MRRFSLLQKNVQCLSQAVHQALEHRREMAVPMVHNSRRLILQKKYRLQNQVYIPCGFHVLCHHQEEVTLPQPLIREGSWTSVPAYFVSIREAQHHFSAEGSLVCHWQPLLLPCLQRMAVLRLQE